jgi:ubiquinone/menaquinone biosynthesis C-methylase UbiE
MRTYPLGTSDEEIDRLLLQAELIFNPPTRRLLQDAGIKAGMKVLDLGSGVGDVALLAAELVGPTGSVLGVDLSPKFVAAARQRVQDAGMNNVEFIQADLHGLDLDATFDAIVGRVVLAYLKDPGEVLLRLTSCLKPGGVVAFREFDSEFFLVTFPLSPTAEDIRHRIDTFMKVPPEQAGIDLLIGRKLQKILSEAGLTNISLTVDAVVGAEPNWYGWRWLEAQIPMFDRAANHIGLTELFADLDTASVGAQIREEVVGQNGMVRIQDFVSASGQKPK